MSTQTFLAGRSLPSNPNGIPPSSPGLRGTSYPGNMSPNPAQPQRGCAPSAPTRATTPLGLPSSAPRSQGRCFAPTLGFEPESRWDSHCVLAGQQSLLPGSCVRCLSPSPRPSPAGRGSHAARPRPTERALSPKHGRSFPLSQRERAGVRENSHDFKRPSERQRAVFSLAPIAGEGRGEGATRPADRGPNEVHPALFDQLGLAHHTVPSARPLTLTLSPGGGEGIRALSRLHAPPFSVLHPRSSASSAGTHP